MGDKGIDGLDGEIGSTGEKGMGFDFVQFKI